MKTLIWKEWREQRLFFFLAVGIIILSRITPVFFPKGMIHYDKYAGILSHFALPVIFSLFLGAVPFANEFTKNTKSFFLSQPITSAKVFWIKFLSELILLITLALLAHFVFGVPLENPFVDPAKAKEAHWFILPSLLFLIVFYSSACLSSLLLKNTLSAIICAPFILLLVSLFVYPLLIVSSLTIYLQYPFALICPLILLTALTIYSFLIWQRALVKDASSRRVILTVTAIILIISFGIHAIANIIATREFNKTSQQAKAAGIKLTLEEVVPLPVPDKENAAPVYQQAFNLAEKLKTKYKKEWEYMPYASKPPEKLLLSNEQKNDIARIMKEPDFADFYALVEKAVNLPACRFDIKYEKGLLVSIDIQFHLSALRNLGRLVAARTYILTEEKRYHGALKSARVGLRLGDSLTNEPILIVQLVRIALDVIATNSSRLLLSAPLNAISSGEYQTLISEIDQKDKRLTRAIEGDPVVCGGYYMESTLLDSDRIIPPGNRNLLIAFRNYMGRPMFKPDSTFYMRGIITLVGFSKQPYFSIKSALDTWEREITPNPKLAPKYVMARMTLPAVSRLLLQQAKYIANLESFKLALALKIYKQKHGYYPDKIAILSPEIIQELPLDPFTGKDYIYRKEGRGFLLYSIGPNEKDDNGIYDQKQSQKFDDIAWKVLN